MEKKTKSNNESESTRLISISFVNWLHSRYSIPFRCCLSFSLSVSLSQFVRTNFSFGMNFISLDFNFDQIWYYVNAVTIR